MGVALHVAACQSCSAFLPDGARFCPSCGAPQFAGRNGPASTSRARHAVAQERRITTTLFCDLVGFTTLAEQADPEDVDALLRPYFALTRHVIEQHGGVVEKFIGDAVVGVFGVLRLHEDDAERAVRAAVRLQERLADLPPVGKVHVQARIGVNTGRTLVRLDIEPSSGEGFLVGDPVNTAARLQAIAPPGGVIVGELTHSMALHTATYEPLEPVRLRGKREVMRPWLVTGVVGRRGVDLRRSFVTPLVGREVELGILTGMFDKAWASSEPQIAFIVGDAGVGKSRLLHELAAWLDERPDVIAWWRQAHCPAYGEGLSMAPLAQVVREHAGIVDTDGAEQMEDKLQRVLEDEPDAEWLAARLRPLLGLPSTPAHKEENFAAWLRFIELMARTKPTVLVFEDVHWASQLMVEFLWYLTANLEGVPLLGIGTARPEFLASQPDYETVRAADERVGRALQLDLHPLSPPEAERLVASLILEHDLEESAATIAQQCGGNPLYAEELVRLLEQPQALNHREGHLPTSLVSLIAARLDALEDEHRSLLADAAVAGETFWPSLLAWMGKTDAALVDRGLSELQKRGLVCIRAPAATAAEHELAFTHALTRDVAYSQMTRTVLAKKHAAAAEWIEAHGVAEDWILAAHHYFTSIDLARRTNDDRLVGQLRPQAVRALARAAHMARQFDFSESARYARQAVELAQSLGDQLPELLVAWGSSLARTGHLRVAVDAMEMGTMGLLTAGKEREAASGLISLSRALLEAGSHRAPPTADRALGLLERADPTPELVAALELRSLLAFLDDDPAATISAADRAIACADRLDLAPPSGALESKALASLAEGRGAEAMTACSSILASMHQHSSPGNEAHSLMVVASICLVQEGPQAAVPLFEEGIGHARRRRDHEAELRLRLGQLEARAIGGDWGVALVELQDLERQLTTNDYRLSLKDTVDIRRLLLALRGDIDELRAPTGPSTQEDLVGSASLTILVDALAAAALGHGPTAVELLMRLPDDAGFVSIPTLAYYWNSVIRLALDLGEPSLARRLIESLIEAKAAPAPAKSMAAAVDCALRRKPQQALALFDVASEGWLEFGVPFELAHARLGEAACLIELGRANEATALLDQATALLRSLGARPDVEKAQALERLASADDRRCPRATPMPS